MTVLYNQAVKKKTRITLEVETLNDFNPHQIDWRKVLQLEDNNIEEQYPEQINNNRGDYSSLFGTLSERDLDA